MATALLSHSTSSEHVPPKGHPECPERLKAIRAALKDPDFEALVRIDAPMATDELLELAHPAAYVATIRAVAPADGLARLDADTWMSPGSLDAALYAVGANVKATDMVLEGDVDNAFCALRPPGHHAERSRAMGFCLFGSLAIGAKHALDNHGLERVAVVDFDVHHGNGTQDLLWNDQRALFCSTHQMPLYPGSGSVNETGAHGNVVNVPLAPETNGAALRMAIEKTILPALEDHAPEMLFISAGFDAHEADPLANLRWNEEDFIWVTRALCDFAERRCGGRVVSNLEGGYDLEALAASSAAHVRVLMNQ